VTTPPLPATADRPRTPWYQLPTHHRWLAGEADRLLDFAAGSLLPDGYGWLGGDGRLRAGTSSELWITTRMTYVFALAAL